MRGTVRPIDTSSISSALATELVDIDHKLGTGLQRLCRQSGQLVGVRRLITKRLLLGVAALW